MCSPSVETVNWPSGEAVAGAAPSTIHWTSSTPEWASVPFTVTSTGVVRQPVGSTVVSVGSTVSTRTK